MKDSVDCAGFNPLRQGGIPASPAATLLAIARHRGIWFAALRLPRESRCSFERALFEHEREIIE